MKNKISHTAAYIAIKFYGLTLNEMLGKYFPESVKQYYKQVVDFLPSHLSWNLKALKSSFWRRFFVFTEELLLPGDLMHIICRKYYLHTYTSGYLDAGVEQLLILGAGFDHLGFYYSKKNIPVFEVDTPNMIEQKREFLLQSGYQNEYLHLCPLDVNISTLGPNLTKQPDFDPSKKTLVVAEGFFDYLSLNKTRQILDEIRALCPDHHLVTTLFSLEELNILHRFSFTSGVAMVGEAIKLPLGKKYFIDMLEETGYRITKELSYDQMREDIIEPSGISLRVMKGFYIIQARSK